MKPKPEDLPSYTRRHGAWHWREVSLCRAIRSCPSRDEKEFS